MRKRFTAPAYGINGLINGPRSAAVTLIVKCTVVCPAGLLGRCMKADVAYVHADPHIKNELLNRDIQVLVIDGVLIVPYAVRRPCHFGTDKQNPIVSRIRLVLIHRRSRPSHDGRLGPNRGTQRGKCEVRRAATYVVLSVGNVVIHVALPGM